MSSTTDTKATVSAAGEGKTDITTKSDSVLVSSQGRTTIADTVVSKIAGIATREAGRSGIAPAAG